jgi:hypothetical protein
MLAVLPVILEQILAIIFTKVTAYIVISLRAFNARATKFVVPATKAYI